MDQVSMLCMFCWLIMQLRKEENQKEILLSLNLALFIEDE